MNHQIRILAEQATKKYDRLGNEIPFAQPDLEKFAELIVRECLSYAKDGDLDFMKFMIKKNFGVEE